MLQNRAGNLPKRTLFSMSDIRTLSRLSIPVIYAAIFCIVYLSYLTFFSTVLRNRSDAFNLEFSSVVMPIIELTLFYWLGRMAW